MPKQIILLVTHGNPSTNKLLIKSIQQKGLDTKLAMIVSYKERDIDTDRPRYSLELFRSKTDDISEEQRLFMEHLPAQGELLYLEDIAGKFFNILFEVGSVFAFKKITDVFDFHLFTEVNLASVAGECITKEFHDSVHFFGNHFKRLVNPCESHYYVYGYSNTQIARDKAKNYFAGKSVDGFELEITIDDYSVDIKENLCNYVIHQNILDENAFSDEDYIPIRNRSVRLFELSIERGASIIDSRKDLNSVRPFYEEDNVPELNDYLLDDIKQKAVTHNSKKTILSTNGTAFFKFNNRKMITPQRTALDTSISGPNIVAPSESSSRIKQKGKSSCIVS